MFGRSKRRIQREGEDLKKKYAKLEEEQERLHGEIQTLLNQKQDLTQAIEPAPLLDDVASVSPRPRAGGRRAVQPTRLQMRRKRNKAVVLIFFALLILTWILAKLWRSTLG